MKKYILIIVIIILSILLIFYYRLNYSRHTSTTMPSEVENKYTQLTGGNSDLTWKKRKFIVAGHRGFPAVAPENTIASFNKAIEANTDFLEFDIQISKDGIPVIMHDSTVDRTTNGTGKVKDKTFQELRQLDAGSKFLNQQFKDERIPTLDEVLKLAKKNSIPIFPEIKDYRSNDDISIMLKKIIDDGFEDAAIIQDFNFKDFDKVREISKKIKLAYLIYDKKGFENALQSEQRLGNAYFFVEQNYILKNPDIINICHKNNIGVIAWTVDNKEKANSLINLNVDGVITNNTEFIKKNIQNY